MFQFYIIIVSKNGGYVLMILCFVFYYCFSDVLLCLGHLSIVECLLKNGATVDAARTDGSTPLYIASQKGKDIYIYQRSFGIHVSILGYY